MLKCQFCDNKFTTNSSLKLHQQTAKYCLKIRNKESSFICKYCESTFSTKPNMMRHILGCKEKDSLEKNNEINKLNKLLESQKKEYEKKISYLQDKLENIALKAIERPFEEIYADTFSIDPICQFEKDNEYKLSSLNIGEGYNIEHREKDGYINVTNLCKAARKNFSNWRRLDKTQAFLQALSSSMVIHINELIRYKMGSIHERATWVHPHVAINIAQWISPEFDVKVSAWVYEAMMTGKVDISNTKTYKEIQKENKILKNKYVKRRPRVEYKDKYVIYILTTRLMQKERRYIMGKATNLTNRLSTYNKSDEHRVVYYKGCGDEETMSLVENAVFHHLREYREQANRERFILPENEEIKLFSTCINKSVEYFKK
jgi:hypothetical protein